MARTPTKPMTLKLTAEEREELRSALAEMAMLMDDDGREGAFATSPLAGILRRLQQG